MAGSTVEMGTRELERSIRYGLLAMLLEGIRRRDPGAIVNALVALIGATLPTAIEREFNVEFRPWQRVYAVTAMLTTQSGCSDSTTMSAGGTT